MKNYLKNFNNKKTFFRAVAIGSSITAQDFCHPNWLDWLTYTFKQTDDWDNDWRRKIINSGRDGATLKHVLTNFNEEIAFYKPHVVILSVGLNSVHPKLDKDKFENQLNLVFKKIKEFPTDLIAWSPYVINNKRYDKDISQINNIYKKLSKKYDAVYIDMYSEFKKYDLNLLFTFDSEDNDYWGTKEGEIDFIHCNVAGNQIIASKIAKEAFSMELYDYQFGTMNLLNLSNYKKKK